MNKQPINPKGGNKNRMRNEEHRSSFNSKVTIQHCHWDKDGLVFKDEYEIKVGADIIAKDIMRAIAVACKKAGKALDPTEETEETTDGDGDGFDPVN